MRRLGLLAIGSMAATLVYSAATAEAREVIVRAPFVSVYVAPGQTQVNAPFANVNVVSPVKVVAPGQPEQLGPPKPAEGEVVLKPMTHYEFGRLFKPAPGTYEVVLLHPDTCCPWKVCFTLPCGCPKCVRIEGHEVEFDYGSTEVEIRFCRNGTVRIEYRD